MSDGRNVPPTPGTEPRTPFGTESGLGRVRERRYREEPGIYRRHREAGTHAYTLDEIDARILACAADEAAVTAGGPVRPALFRELDGVFWYRLFRGLPEDREAMAGFGMARELAGVRRDAAEANSLRLERRRRELESWRMRMPRPVTGLTLSRAWFLLVCLAPAALIETIGSTPSVQEAFKLPIGWAILFAVGISAVLVLTAEQLGNALAAAMAYSRRRTAVAAAVLLVLAITAGVFAIVFLAQSRERNLSFREAVQASRETRDESGRIGGSVGAPPVAGATEGGSSGPTKPDFQFFIPLSFLVLAASTLVAFRVEVARDHNELGDEIERFRSQADGQREVAEEEVDGIVESVEGENAVLQDLVAHVEQERNLLALWISRFEVEYGRFCAAGGVTPRQVRPIPIPEVPAILRRILRPQEGGEPSEAEAAAFDGLAGGAAGSGDLPDGDDAAGPDGPGPPAPDTGPTVGAEPPEWVTEPTDESRERLQNAYDSQGRPLANRWIDEMSNGGGDR